MKPLKTIAILFSFIFLSCESDNVAPVPNQSWEKTIPKEIDTITPPIDSIISTSDTANKQTPKEFTGYKVWNNGMLQTCHFEKGKKHGIYRMWYGDSTERKVLMVSLYNHDSLIYTAYPTANKNKLFFYGKKTIVNKDSIYIKVPNTYNRIWYEGLYLNGKPTGTHKFYHEHGRLKAVVNYSNASIVEWDDYGKQIFKGSFTSYSTKDTELGGLSKP